MKNIELCMKCTYGRLIHDTETNEIIGRSCELPMTVFIDHNEKGLYKNETDDSCYDYREKR